MADKRKGYPDWIRLYGIGFEFVAAVAVFALIGYAIDCKYESSPWGVLVGVALGLIGGTYNLVRESLAAFRRLPPIERHEMRPPDSGGEAEADGLDDPGRPNEP